MTSKQKTQEKLVNTAKKLFARKGFDRVTVDEIVREAGVAKGTFYLYFSSKEELIKEVAIRSMPFEALSEVFEPMITAKYKTLSDYLMALGRQFFEHYSDRDLAMIFYHMVSIKSVIPPIEDVHRELCSNLIEEGTLKIMAFVDVDRRKAEVAFRTFLGSLLHYLYSEECTPMSYEDYLKNLVEILVSGMSKDKS